MRPYPSVSRRRFGSLMMGGVASSWIAGAGWAESGTGVGDVARAQLAADGLPRSPPEAKGVPSSSIIGFLDDVERAGLELHSFMLSRAGSVIAEGWWWPYAPQRIHMTHSLTKSVMVSGVAIAMDEARFGLDDRVVSFFPEHIPPDASENLKAMTVRDLLTMRTGHDHETSGSVWRPLKTSWVEEFMKIPVVYQPGTKWVYTSAASYMLSAIITKTTGQKLADYIRPRMLDPMGIRNFHWDVSPEGVTPGGNGLSWQTSDSLKLGMLYARRGAWNGQQLLSPQWITEASRQQVPDGPYGYQWWIGPGGAFFAAGMFSQFSIVFPEHDAVLAVFAAIDDSAKLLPLVWKHFPSAFATQPTPRSADAIALRRREAGLRVLAHLSKTASPTGPKVSGRQFKLSPNDQGATAVVFDFARGKVRYTLIDDRGSHAVAAGLGRWIEQEMTMPGARLHHEYEPDTMRVVAGARWRGPDELEITWQYVEAAFRDTVVCRFDGDRVSIDRGVNVNSAALKLPTLNGQISSKTS
jgi:CubicO group peptidase (beta-lactamase class C family)